MNDKKEISYHVLAVDGLAIGGQNIKKLDLDIRLNKLVNVMNSIETKLENITFSTQIAYHLEELSQIFTKHITELPYKTDGLVFTPADWYKLGFNKFLLKWKPPQLNTVDFLLRVIRDSKNVNHYSLSVISENSEIKHHAWLNATTGIEETLSEKIIECNWNPEGISIIPDDIHGWDKPKKNYRKLGIYKN